MRLILSVSEVDQYDCQRVKVTIHQHGHVVTASTYEAGSLYMQRRDVDQLLGRLMGDPDYVALVPVEIRNRETGVRVTGAR